MQRIILLSGPSCVGKGPLLRALNKLYPDTYKKLERAVLHNDRSPRVGEVDGVDYIFKAKGLQSDSAYQHDYIVLEIRPGNWQALPLSSLDTDAGRIIFAEVHYKFVEEIQSKRLSGKLKNLDIKTIFLSPLSGEEIKYLLAQPNVDAKALEEIVASIMRKKLIRRTTRQNIQLSLKDLEDIEKRATRAFEEMNHAHTYDHVIPNHDGEDSDNWDQFYYPIGDARKTCECFMQIIEGKECHLAEQWEYGLINKENRR